MFDFLKFFKKEPPKQEEKSIPFEQQPHIIERNERNFEFLKKVLEKYPINTWVRNRNDGYNGMANYTVDVFRHPEVPFELKCNDLYYGINVNSYFYPISREQAKELYNVYVLNPLREEERRLATINQQKLKKFEELINS